MAWLLRQGEVLASVELVSSPLRWVAGLSSPPADDHVRLMTPAHLPVTVSGSRGLDVAFLDTRLVVLAVSALPPRRMALGRIGTRAVLEAEAGAFERWHLHPRDVLEIKD